MAEVSTADFRDLLLDALDNDDLMALCQDHFHTVYNKLNTGMTRPDMVRLLLDYCIRQKCLPQLLQAAQRRSDRFAHITAVRPPVSVAGDGHAPPAPPAGWFLAHPYAMPPHFTGRDNERRTLSYWLNRTSGKPLFVVRALGGFGKSALTWHWLMHDVDPQQWPRVVWWSFYETQATAENFVAETLEYLGVSTGPQVGGQKQVYALIASIRAPGTLLVLDGFERALRAYNSMNAAYQGDTDMTPPGYDPAGCVSPLMETLLRHVAARTDLRGRVLMTTRMCPTVLVGHGGDLLVGCHEQKLTALSPDDAVAFFAAQGVQGARAEIERACKAYDYHPLSLRLLAGLCVHDPRHPCDITAVASTDISGDLKQRQHHVLEQSYAILDPAAQLWLRRIACFREPVEEHVLRALAKVETGGFWSRLKGLLGGTRAEAPPTAPPLDNVLRTLLGRGLVQHDQQRQRFDLHPIVRRYAYDQMGRDERGATHAHLRGYFDALDTPGRVQRIEELAEQIELYHHTARAGLYDEARVIFRDRIDKPTYYQFGAYELQIELLRVLFPDGEEQPPRLKGKGAQAWTLTALANSYSLAGQPRRAIPHYEGYVAISKKWDDKQSIAIGLNNLAQPRRNVGALQFAEENLRRSIKLCREIANEAIKAVGHQELGRLLAYRGAWQEADEELTAALTIFEQQDEVQVQSATWAYRALRVLLMARAGVGGNPADALTAAQHALAKADETARTRYPHERDYVQAHWLLGAAHLACGAPDEAAPHLEESLTRCRSINNVESEADILLALARLRQVQGSDDEARRLAEEARLTAERCGYALQAADAHLLLAELAQVAGDTDIAREHAAAARTHATCDGPPYTYRVAYDEAGTLLARLG